MIAAGEIAIDIGRITIGVIGPVSTPHEQRVLAHLHHHVSGNTLNQVVDYSELLSPQTPMYSVHEGGNPLTLS